MSDPDRPCGIYRTTVPIAAAVPAGVLVYYHNHGEPGPGVYLPRDWRNNRAVFHEGGTTVPDERYAGTRPGTASLNKALALLMQAVPERK
jgi:hypothetical protein